METMERTQVEDFTIENIVIPLEYDESFFRQNTTSRIVGGVSIPYMEKSKRMCDIGCGGGVLGILGGKVGVPYVHSSDIVQAAVDAARRNVERNNLSGIVKVSQGDLYEAFGDDKFDLHVNDAAGMNEKIARKLKAYCNVNVPTGGGDGTRNAVRVLGNAPKYALPGAILIMPMIGLSDLRIIKDAMYRFGEKNVKQIYKRDLHVKGEEAEAAWKEIEEELAAGRVTCVIRKPGKHYIFPLEIYAVNINPQ